MPITVAQVLPALESGGVERGTLEVAAELVKRGHRSIVISAGGRLVDDLTGAGSEHVRIAIGRKSPTSFRHVYTLRRILLAEKIDILHARSRLPAWISCLARATLSPADRPRFITTVHGPYRPNYYSSIMTRGECVIAVSEYIRNYINENYPGVEDEKIITIPRGVSDTEFYPGFRPAESWLAEWKARNPQLQGKYIICMPGRISRRKGHEDFITIMKELITRGKPVHGLVPGSPHKYRRHFYAELLSRVRQLELDEHITFLGHRKDIREIFSVCDLVLSLSKLPEAFGRTVLEALSLGKPVIAYDMGGVSEIMQELFNDGLTECGSPDLVVNKICRYQERPPVVSRNRDYLLSRMLEQELALYEKLAVRH